MNKLIKKIVERLENAKYVGNYTEAIWQRSGICEAIKIIQEEAKAYNDGWIPCRERLPERNDSVLCWAKSTARGGDVCFVGSCHNGFWFLQSSADTHSFPGQYVIVAWKPIQPYRENEKGGVE